MGKLSFEYTEKENVREANKITFDVPDDMNLSEFKIMTVRLAQALGFQQKSINETFGNLVFGNEKIHELQSLCKDIKKHKT